VSGGQTSPAKRTSRLTLFFAKTYFFHPRSNPVPVALLVFLVFLWVEKSLDPFHLALVIYLSVLGHHFTGGVFGNGRGRGGGSPDHRLGPFYRVLPARAGEIFAGYVAAVLLYGIAVYALLGPLLADALALPDWESLEVIRSARGDGDSVTVVRGFAVSARGIRTPAMRIIEPSLLFDGAGSLRGGWISLAAAYLILFVYVSVLPVYRALGPHRLAGAIHRIPLAAYLLLGVVFVSEIILTSRETGAWTAVVRSHTGVTGAALLALAAGTALSILIMSRTIVSRLRRCPP